MTVGFSHLAFSYVRESGIGEDSRHRIGRVIFLSMPCRHSSRNVHIFT